ncbi:MAG TPA: alkaline phosphatase family protein [Gammaproteobacteria bacterium]|jgi:alkaline phosphatase D|nr:alkaline phosphatase family protein [Gammaproteobacteria bacterium]HIK72852.1 alkaline phosphatase family protein [Gammaproteobacteria bacterium]
MPFTLFSQSDNSFILGMGSCLDQDNDQQEIWASLKKEDLTEFFFLGDNIYGDNKDGSLEKMLSAYKKQSNNLPNWLNEIEINAIWDDHDFGVNDGGEDYKEKAQAQKLFLDFWKIQEADRRSNGEGIYFSKDVLLNNKIIKIIGLDTRYFRSPLEGEKRKRTPTKDTSKTILGVDQWSWLENQLTQDIDILVLASSIQVIATNHGFEKWGNFPHERQRLFKLLNGIEKPVVMLSGDRHKAGLYRIGNLYEITSSSLNKPLPAWLSTLWDKTEKETDEFLLGEMFYESNYGILEINKTGLITLALKDKQGKILNKIVISL